MAEPTTELVEGVEDTQLPSTFRGGEEFMLILGNLLKLQADIPLATDRVDRLINLIEPYQQQPNLLDPYLKRIVLKVVGKLREHILRCNFTGLKNGLKVGSEFHHQLFRLVYHLTKVRGYKVVMNLFSHEVNDLEPTFFYLVAELDGGHWESIYILLIWLAMICLVPFDVAKIDSGFSKRAGFASLAHHIIHTCMGLLQTSGRASGSAAILLGKLLTRKDLIPHHLAPYLGWARAKLAAGGSSSLTHGILSSLVAITKSGAREELLPFLPALLDCIAPFRDQESLCSSNALIRKAVLKLAQRVAIGYLRPRVASWRYLRGSRSLSSALGDGLGAVKPSEPDEVLAEEEFLVPESTEEIIALLLAGISDKEGSCRWTAAKGLGRLTQRLPQELAREVVNFMLDQLTGATCGQGHRDLASIHENTWHGACLALAELARRGLLPEDLLSRCLERVLEAHRLDIRRGSHSVGSNVRDAACYVFWSFARAYPAAVFQPHALALAQQLVVTSVFDREINVRRASSAAFQEFVGRLQLFPDGIQVMVKIDYFAVGNLANAFLRASVHVAGFSAYRAALFRHLYQVSFRHWDVALRRLAALALGAIAPLAPKEACMDALRSLLAHSNSHDLATRHGAMLGMGAICRAVSSDDLPGISPEAVTGVFGRLTPHDLSTFGSELLLEGAAFSIRDLCHGRWPLSQPARAAFRRILDTCLYRKEGHLQEAAAACLGVFGRRPPCTAAELEPYPFMRCLQKAGSSEDVVKRCGAGLALGQLCQADTAHVVDRMAQVMLDKRFHSSHLDQTNLVLGLGSVLERSLQGQLPLAPAQLRPVGLALLEGLRNYTSTNQGDVGSQVRKAAMEGVVPFIKVSRGALLGPEMVGGLLGQSVEKIDRVRVCAGRCLQEIFRLGLRIPEAARLATLLEAIDWQSPASVFPRMVPILRLAPYRAQLLAGLVSSAGGISESLIRHAGGSLIDFLLAAPPELRGQVTQDLLVLFKGNQRVDRVTVPLLEVIRQMLEAGIFDLESEPGFPRQLAQAIRSEHHGVRDLRKLVACAKVLCALAPLPDIATRKVVWAQLLRFLTHASPKVRITTSENLYLALASSPIAKGEAVEALLLDTDWSGPPSELRPAVFALYPQFGLVPPKLKPRPTPS